jgi:hypothetical protein
MEAAKLDGWEYISIHNFPLSLATVSSPPKSPPPTYFPGIHATNCAPTHFAYVRERTGLMPGISNFWPGDGNDEGTQLKHLKTVHCSLLVERHSKKLSATKLGEKEAKKMYTVERSPLNSEDLHTWLPPQVIRVSVHVHLGSQQRTILRQRLPSV